MGLASWHNFMYYHLCERPGRWSYMISMLFKGSRNFRMHNVTLCGVWLLLFIDNFSMLLNILNSHPSHPFHPCHPGHPSHPTQSSHPSHPNHPSHPSQPSHPSNPSHPCQPSHLSHPSHPSHSSHPSHPSHPSIDANSPAFGGRLTLGEMLSFSVFNSQHLHGRFWGACDSKCDLQT